MTVKLQKFLASCGIASRRECERLIVDGRVRVDGGIATLGARIDPDDSVVAVDDEQVVLDRNVYVVLNKPKGVVTTVKDTHDRPTVLDLITGVEARIFPVGRLDMDVTGTLVLTNDGELTHRLSHPSFKIDKVYHAWVAGRVNRKAVNKLRGGVLLEDGMTAPAKASVLKRSNDSTLLRIVIHEGRKRLVKRMCAAVGHPVRDLRRTRIGIIESDDLIPGEWRYLSAEEVESLKRLTNLSD